MLDQFPFGGEQISHTVTEFSGLQVMIVDDNRDATDGISVLFRTVGAICSSNHIRPIYSR